LAITIKPNKAAQGRFKYVVLQVWKCYIIKKQKRFFINWKADFESPYYFFTGGKATKNPLNNLRLMTFGEVNAMSDFAAPEVPPFLAGEAQEMIDRYQKAWNAGETARLKLARELAAEEYHHPDCEAAGSTEKQRSFCLSRQQASAQSLLLIHGFTACPFEMRELGEYLYRQGYNVFGVRLAGHGTRVADFARTTWRDWFDSARRGLVVAGLLGRETVVIGESMGGALALLLARAFPGAVAKLILCAPCLKIKDFRAELIAWPLLQKLIPQQDMGVPPDGFGTYWYRFIPTTAVAQLAAVARQARRAGPEIIAPTLLIQAENDQMVNPRGAWKFFKSLTKLTNGHKKLIRFADGHHNLTLDFNPRKDKGFGWIARFIEGD
jgi:carboxylesterase